MSNSREERIEELVEQAHTMPPEQWSAFLGEQCADEQDLRREVEALLGVSERRIRFLETPCLEQLGKSPNATNGDDDYTTRFIGQRIGQYTIQRILGAGGMAVVFEAQQEQPRRSVALKLMRRGLLSRAAIRRFRHEVEILANLVHPNIAQVYAADVHDDGTGGVPYFAMELVTESRTITEYAAANNLSIPDRLTLLTRVCEAVHYGHQKGVIHRDLKPQNILVDAQGQVKVIDFGVAKATDSDIAVTTMATDAGRIVGTLEYMNPEQCSGRPGDLDARGDVYSLGVVMYELLSDRVPFDFSGLRIDQATRIICYDEPQRLGTINTMLRGDLETITRTAMEKDPNRRYRSALELADDIRRYLRHDPIAARPPSAAYHLRKFIQRNTGVAATLAALFLVLIAGLVATSALYLRAERQAERAEAEAVRALAAESQAQHRAAQLQQVVDFQAEQLSGIDTIQMGTTIREGIIDNRLQALRGTGTDETEIEQALRDLNDALAGVNFTNIALDTLDDNIFERALQTVDQQFADHPVVRARLLQTLATAMSDLGMHQRALPPQAEALSVRRTTLGDKHPSTLSAINNLAQLLTKMGRYDEAEDLHNESLQLRHAVFGANDSRTLTAKNNLGLLLHRMGRTDEAEPLLRRALEGNQLLHGESHSSTLANLNNLGLVLHEAGRLSEAEAYYRRAVEGRKQLLGAEHPDTLTSIANLGSLLRQSGRIDEALDFFKRALEGLRHRFGDDHPSTFTSLNSMGALLRQKGRLDDAKSHYRAALEGRRRVLGDRHPETLVSINNMGSLLRQSGRLKEAEAYYREALEARRAVLGDEHPVTILSLNDLGSLLGALGRWEESKALSKQTIHLARQALPADHWHKAVYLTQHARVLQQVDRLDEAAASLHEALDIYSNAFGQDHPRARGMMRHLADFYDQWHEHDPEAGHAKTAARFRSDLK